jgi:hypothetical protein
MLEMAARDELVMWHVCMVLQVAMILDKAHLIEVLVMEEIQERICLCEVEVKAMKGSSEWLI